MEEKNSAVLIKLGERTQKVELEEGLYVSMTADVYHELMSYVSHYDSEVSGCGIIEKIVHVLDKDKKKSEIEYHISEVILPSKQTNTASHTNIDEEVIHEVLHKRLSEGLDVEQMKLHWHSHNSMGVFHSSTDTDNYSDLNNGTYLISLVLNKSFDVLARLDMYSPVRLSVSGIPVYIQANVASDSTTTRVLHNIEALDKYIEDNKTKYGTRRPNNNVESWDVRRRCWVYTLTQVPVRDVEGRILGIGYKPIVKDVDDEVNTNTTQDLDDNLLVGTEESPCPHDVDDPSICTPHNCDVYHNCLNVICDQYDKEREK